jgi:SET domain-containing protein
MIPMPTKIYVDRSGVHGWGVFAKEEIQEGELLEETPFVILFDRGEESNPDKKGMLSDYRFSFPASPEWKHQVMPFGCGGIYNHSGNPNARWEVDEERKTFKFYSIKGISPGEEIFTFYGPAYYWDERPHIQVK